MTTKPAIRKVGTWWRVYINDRMWSSTPTFPEAIERAHGIASYAHRIRFQRDLERITKALERIDRSAERADEAEYAGRYLRGPGRGLTDKGRAAIAQLKEGHART